MMNSDYNEQDEYLEAPEDDEFSDFDGTESDAPESVQGLIGGPSLVFPDLVRIQSICGSTVTSDNLPSQSRVNQVHTTSETLLDIASGSTNSNNYSLGGAIPRNSQSRVLNPPDVSLLPSSSSSSLIGAPQPSTLDLCNSTRTNSKLNFSNNLTNLKNGVSSSIPTSNNVSSPNSTSSSSSASSNSTNSSGLILSNSSSQSNLRFIDADVNSTTNNEIGYNDQYNPLPSSSYNSASTLVSNQNYELETIKMQKTLLKQQLMQKDAQIEELQRALNKLQVNNSQPASLENALIKRIDDSFERLNLSLENTMGTLERRIDDLENRFKLTNGTNGIDYRGKSTSGDLINELNNFNFESQLTQACTDIHKRLGEQQRHEMCSLFRNILTSAVREIDKFVSTKSSFVTSECATVSNGKNSNFKPPNFNGR